MSHLYLETVHLPARLQINIMMMTFLQYLYILLQGQDPLMLKFVKGQCKSPINSEWFSSVRRVKENWILNNSFAEIAPIKKPTYQKLVNESIMTSALYYLWSRVKSRGKEIDYNNIIQCQGYLLPNYVMQCEIFSYRTRMNKQKYNFPGTNGKYFCKYGIGVNKDHPFWRIHKYNLTLFVLKWKETNWEFFSRSEKEKKKKNHKQILQ